MTMDDGERDRLLTRYANGADAVDQALDGASDTELDRRPPSGAWTAREVVHHLADSEAMAFIRLRRLIAEDEPVIVGYDEPEWARRLHYDRPIDSSQAVLRAVRTGSLDLLRSLGPDEWKRAGTHSESGPYTVAGWLRIYASHGHDHADQIRRARRGDD
jgi:DinB superfamily